MKRALGLLSVLLFLASPWVLYLTLSQRRLDLAALMLVGWGILRAAPIVLAAERDHRWAALQLSLVALAFALLGWLLQDELWLLILPSATQASFALVFLRSLRTTPLIEHFARMVKKELSPPELAHCRRWTGLWAGYLFVLAAVGLALARWAALATWTLYVGLVNYLLIGALFGVEYLVRKIQFRDYGKNPIDLLLAKLFPAHTGAR